MTTRFNHLQVPDEYNQYFTKYPQGYTILEALLNWVQQVDNLVDNVNDWNTYLEGFVLTFDKELQEKVTTTLEDWNDSGFLNVVINDALQKQLVYSDVTKFTAALRNREITKIKLIGDSNGQGYLATPSQIFWEQFKLLMNNLFTGHNISFDNQSQGGKEWVWFNDNKAAYINDTDDAVIIMLGTNDRNIAYSYTEIITAIEGFLSYAKTNANHVIVCSVPPTGFNEQEYTFGVEQINQMIRKVCYEKGYMYVDVAEAFNEMVYTMGLSTTDVLQPDNLHYTDQGHELIYKSLQRKLGLVHNRDNQWFKPRQSVNRNGLIAYPDADQTTTFTTPISKTRNGIVLVWAPYNSGDGTVDNDYKIYTHIPRQIALDQIAENGGTEMTMNVLLHSRDFSIISPKTVFITDTRVKGSIENAAAPFTNNGVTITPKGYALVAVYNY